MQAWDSEIAIHGTDDQDVKGRPPLAVRPHIPDSLQVSNGGEGKCSWDSVRSFGTPEAREKFVASFREIRRPARPVLLARVRQSRGNHGRRGGGVLVEPKVGRARRPIRC